MIDEVRAQLAAAEREWNEHVEGLAAAERAYQDAQIACKDEPTTANGKALEKTEAAHRLAQLATEGAAERLDAARRTLAAAERAAALAELADLDAASSLAAFEEQIAPHVTKLLELRAAAAEAEAHIKKLGAAFASGRQSQVIARARELRAQVPAEHLFDKYAEARLAGLPPAKIGQPAPARFTIQNREPRNVGAELLALSARKRAAAEQPVTP